jgi:hypothetical protein
MRRVLLCGILAAAACGGGNDNNTGGDMSANHDAGGGVDSGITFNIGAPITAATNTWTWTTIDGAVCDDGTPTGVGVNLNGSANTIIFLEGGGACWDYDTCTSSIYSVHGPYASMQFNSAVSGGYFASTIFDRTLTGNPFKDYNFVYVPYCTSDVHGGQNVATYYPAGEGPGDGGADGGTGLTEHHVGHLNILADLGRLIPTFTNQSKIVLSGLSAGGFGTLVSLPAVRAAWPNAETYLIDDSGPLISAIPPSLVQDWFTQWKLNIVVDAICGTDCSADLSFAPQKLAAAYPKVRMSLLESEQDQTIDFFFFGIPLQPAMFQAGINALATTHLDPTSNFRYFFVNGSTHTMIFDPAMNPSTMMPFTSNNVQLLPWLTQQVTDDPAWVSEKPAP